MARAAHHGLRDARPRLSKCYTFPVSPMRTRIRAPGPHGGPRADRIPPGVRRAGAPTPATPHARPGGPAYADWSGGVYRPRGQRRRILRSLQFRPDHDRRPRGSGLQAAAIPPAAATRGGTPPRRSAASSAAGTGRPARGSTGSEASLDAANLKRPVPSTVPGFGYAEVRSRPSTSCAPRPSLYGALRARIGYSFDRYLIYGTFGLAGGERAHPGELSGSRHGRAEHGAAGPRLRRLHPRRGRAIRHHRPPRPRASTTATSTSAAAAASRSASCREMRGGPVSTRASFTSNQLFARLMWFPDGLTGAAGSGRDRPARSRQRRHRPLLSARADDPDRAGGAGLPLALRGRAEPDPAPGPADHDGHDLPRAEAHRQHRDLLQSRVQPGLRPVANARASPASSTARRRRPAPRSRSCARTATT